MTAWTPERGATVTRLWNEGLTTAEIGRAVGMSKNAVVGKAHRLQLPPRPSPIRRGKSYPSTPRPSNGAKVANARKAATGSAGIVTQIKPRAPQPPLAVGNAACKWPTGHPGEPDFHFCGEHALLGKPYCPEHYRKAYVAVRPRSDAA